jgi:hypothetical protein
MKCQSVGIRLSEYLDKRLPEEQSVGITAHLRGCSDCSSRLLELQGVRETLRAIPSRPVPQKLHVSLCVAASKERARNLTRRSWTARFRDYRGGVQLWANNLMRPLAIPFAGGLCSALLLFGILVPNFTPNYRKGADVPLGFYTGASLKNTMQYGFSNEVVLDVEIDDQGRMVDYTVTEGQRWMDDPAIRRTIENSLLFATFTPATTFGQPMSGRVRISFRPLISFDIKG